MDYLETVGDVDEDVLACAEEVLDDYFGDEARIDWEYFIDKLADMGDHCDPPFDIESYDNPAIRKIKRHIQKIRTEG